MLESFLSVKQLFLWLGPSALQKSNDSMVLNVASKPNMSKAPPVAEVPSTSCDSASPKGPPSCRLEHQDPNVWKGSNFTVSRAHLQLLTYTCFGSCPSSSFLFCRMLRKDSGLLLFGFFLGLLLLAMDKQFVDMKCLLALNSCG